MELRICNIVLAVTIVSGCAFFLQKVIFSLFFAKKSSVQKKNVVTAWINKLLSDNFRAHI